MPKILQVLVEIGHADTLCELFTDIDFNSTKKNTQLDVTPFYESLVYKINDCLMTMYPDNHISNISIASEAVLSDVNPKYGEPIDRDVEVHLMVGSSGLIDMQITFEGIYRIMSAEGDNKYISTNIQGFNVIVEIDNIWIYGGGAHITVTGYDKANTPFECYISIMAQMM